MTSFVALYRGPSVASAKLVGVSGDAGLVAGVGHRLLGESERVTAPNGDSVDPVLVELERGRRRALRLVHGELASVCCTEEKAPAAGTVGAESAANQLP